MKTRYHLRRKGVAALAGALLLLALPIAAQAQFTYMTQNGTVTITGYAGAGGNVTIPSAINGLPVTSIGDEAFLYNYNLTGVTIPNSVTNIGDAAFEGCGDLARVTIPNTITRIGNNVFSDTALININIPSSVTSIGSQAFAYCDELSSVTIPNGVTSIEDYAFWYCTGLKGVTIPNGVTNLGGFAFYACYSLKAVTIPNGLRRIEESTFTGTALTSVTIPNSVTSIGSEAFEDCGLARVTIPGSVTSIGAAAFAACSSLGSLTISNGVTGIGEGAFEFCGLTNVTIPESVTNIGDLAFTACFSLSAFNVDAVNLFYAGVNGVLFNNDHTKLIQYPCGNMSASYAVPDGVTNIGNDAFANCAHLMSITISDVVASMGDGAFEDSGLTNMMIPNSVTSMGDYVFASCADLKAVIMSNGVSSIGAGAFEDSGLTNVMIPNSVTNIGDSAFADCFSLSVFHVGAANLFYADVNGVLVDKSHSTLIQYPCASASRSYAVPNGITDIGNGAFTDCTNLMSVAIPDSVANIEERAFLGCGDLTSVTMGHGVTNISYAAFEDCYLLAVVFIAGDAPAVGPYAFDFIGHGGEGPFPIPEGATIYYLSNTAGWSNLFAGLPTMRLSAPPEFGTTAEGWNYISDQLQTALITGYAGSNAAVVIPSLINGLPVTGIGSRAFADTALSSVTIPDSVTSIGSAAFENCTNLTSIIIPDSVASIGKDAFAGCEELTNVFFTGNAPTADWSVFGYDPVTVYYLPGASGWDDFSANTGLLTTLWLPQAKTGDVNFGVFSNQFGFNIAWASGRTVVVEACTNLFSPIWTPVSTNILVGGTSYFSDPQWTNYPDRFYRLRGR